MASEKVQSRDNELAQSVTPEPAYVDYINLYKNIYLFSISMFDMNRLKKMKLDANSSEITSVASSTTNESISNKNNKNRKRKRMEIETIDITENTSTTEETSTSASNEIDINSKKNEKKKRTKRKNKNEIFSNYAIKKIIKADQTLNDFVKFYSMDYLLIMTL